MMTFIYYYGWIAFSITLGIALPYGIIRFSRTRLFNTVAIILLKKRRPAKLYHSLAKNGYIYRWSVPILIRFKAVSEE